MDGTSTRSDRGADMTAPRDRDIVTGPHHAPPSHRTQS